jgi:hypothetical protein
MLIQLKTGEWVNPEHVVSIWCTKGITCVGLSNEDVEQIPVGTAEQAEAYRDELAAQINAALR